MAAPTVKVAKVEMHVAVPVVAPAVKVHGSEFSVPPENATVPVGVEEEADVSVTVVVHVVGWSTTIVDGEQEMIVLVGSSDEAAELSATATPQGEDPTFTVATTVFVTPLITEAVFDILLATYRLLFEVSKAIALGTVPTVTVAITVLSLPLITETELDPELVT
jgi:hypothetical protein